MDVQNIRHVPAFITKDGSEIASCWPRGILVSAAKPGGSKPAAGTSSTPHYHPIAEEIYYVLEGTGWIQVAGDARTIVPGDAIAIPPGATHQVKNTGAAPLKFLCCCARPMNTTTPFLVSERSPEPLDLRAKQG